MINKGQVLLLCFVFCVTLILYLTNRKLSLRTSARWRKLLDSDKGEFNSRVRNHLMLRIVFVGILLAEIVALVVASSKNASFNFAFYLLLAALLLQGLIHNQIKRLLKAISMKEKKYSDFKRVKK